MAVAVTVEINPYATGWCYCGRRFSPTNEQVGTSCRGCLTEWVEEPDQEPAPVAYHPVDLEADCQFCGTPTYGRDLCDRCDPFLTDLGRPT